MANIVRLEKDFKVNFISSTRPYFFSARGLVRISASVMVDVTAPKRWLLKSSNADSRRSA